MGVLQTIETDFSDIKTKVEGWLTPANLNDAEVVVDDILALVEKLGGGVAAVQAAIASGANPVVAAVEEIISVVANIASTASANAAGAS
jgi:hypothetical protein